MPQPLPIPFFIIILNFFFKQTRLKKEYYLIIQVNTIYKFSIKLSFSSIGQMIEMAMTSYKNKHKYITRILNVLFE